MHKLESILEDEKHKILWDFEIQIDPLLPARRPDLVKVNKKKGTCRLVVLAVPTNQRRNIKTKTETSSFHFYFPSVAMSKYSDLARELKKLWNMKVTVMPVVISTLGTAPKSLIRELEELEIGGRAEAIQTTALLRSARILRRVLVSPDSSERPSADAGVENSQEVK